MKRVFCLLLALLMLLPIGAQAFAEEAMFCRMCGKQIPADSKVCSFCGEKVVLLEQTTNVKTALNGDAGATVAADVKSAPLAASNGVTVTRISAPSPATAEAPVPGPFNSTVSTSGSLGKVRVTKSPTSESVPYGGSCIFIAHAVNATSVTWYISNADGSMISTAAEAPSRVSGLSVSGANSDTLSLSGIPSWMNGCKVQACFSGEGGPVYSEIAYIWTYQNNQTSNWNDPCKNNRWWNLRNWWNRNYWRNVFRYVERPSQAPRSFHPEIDAEPVTVLHMSHYNPADPGSSWYSKDGILIDQSNSGTSSYMRSIFYSEEPGEEIVYNDVQPSVAAPSLNLPDPTAGDSGDGPSANPDFVPQAEQQSAGDSGDGPSANPDFVPLAEQQSASDSGDVPSANPDFVPLAEQQSASDSTDVPSANLDYVPMAEQGFGGGDYYSPMGYSQGDYSASDDSSFYGMASYDSSEDDLSSGDLPLDELQAFKLPWA